MRVESRAKVFCQIRNLTNHEFPNGNQAQWAFPKSLTTCLRSPFA
jgi:hypothetical protein